MCLIRPFMMLDTHPLETPTTRNRIPHSNTRLKLVKRDSNQLTCWRIKALKDKEDLRSKISLIQYVIIRPKKLVLFITYVSKNAKIKYF